ncbi:MAG: pyruvate dehydrogenase complex dihydrolipoamide acetyltransferase [Phycisphaerae bacterium]
MPIEITMPKLSDTMTDGTLVKWLKKENEKIKPGDVIAEVETDKATQELEAFEPGTVAKLMVKEGEKVAVGGLIVVLAKPEEDVAAIAKAAGGKSASAPAPVAPPAAAAPAQPVTTPVVAAAPAPTPAPIPAPTATSAPGSSRPARISPLARKIAAEKGVDVSSIQGTGPDGRIIKRDVLSAGTSAGKPVAASTAKSSAAAPPVPVQISAKLEAKTIALSNMRQTIARRLLQAKQTVPHFYVSIDVVMDALLELRKAANEQLAPTKLTVTDFIARAVASAVAQVPGVNASFTDTAIIQHGSVNLGIAVAIEDGLVVPVIRDAQTKGIRQMSEEIKQLAQLARSRKLKADQMTGSTITISNLGMYGIREFQAIINPPEAAILAIGGTEARPIVKNGQVVPAQVMTISLSADHRVIDGALGAEFLSKLKAILENPLAMLV